jgi:outer membrane protein, multidrug efflux system
MTRNLSFTIFIVICLAGCTLVPDYTRPSPPVPADWPKGPSYTASPGGQRAAAAIGWESFYSDEKLRKMIELALGNNRDLRVAALNIERARALYRIQRADLFPTVYAAGRGVDERQPSAISSSGESTVFRQYSVGLGFTDYELDLFGRVRSLNAKALEQYFSTEQARRSVQITLIAEVANAFLTLAADREHLKVARDTFESQEASYRLIEKRFKAGASAELDLRQAQTRLEAARRDIAFYAGRTVQDENGLTLLVGVAVPEELLPTELGAVKVLTDISVGLPSEELLKRPDILQAEHLLKAANANIGAARAAFFPRITLSSAFGTVSPQLSGLFRSGSDTWGFSPVITIPIFDTGRNLANLTAAKAERDIYLAHYEKAIQIAFKEVADALALRGTLQDQLSAQETLADAAAGAYRLSDARYKKGIDSYLPVLDAQRSLFVAQELLISLRLAKLTNLVTLYKVLGGGGSEVFDAPRQEKQ